MYDKLLKPRQSFWITLYLKPPNASATLAERNNFSYKDLVIYYLYLLHVHTKFCTNATLLTGTKLYVAQKVNKWSNLAEAKLFLSSLWLRSQSWSPLLPSVSDAELRQIFVFLVWHVALNIKPTLPSIHSLLYYFGIEGTTLIIFSTSDPETTL